MDTVSQITQTLSYTITTYILSAHTSHQIVPCPNILTKCCPSGDDCFSSGCCPTGHQPCSSSDCYDPSISQCCADGTVCELGYNCNGDGTCCPPGQQRCGNTKCYDPKSQKCCTAPGLAWGCEADEECCTEGGADACYNPSSEQCYPGGSCSKDRTCCGNECCGEDYNCGGDGYCTAKPSPPTSRPTGSASAPTATRTITFRYDPDRKVPAQNGELYEATNKAVLRNMCEGIKSYLGFVSQSIELTRTDASTRK